MDVNLRNVGPTDSLYVYVYDVYMILYMYILVGGFNPSEKYYIVSWDDYSQYMEK